MCASLGVKAHACGKQGFNFQVLEAVESFILALFEVSNKFFPKQLLFVRHGEAVFVGKRWWHGHMQVVGLLGFAASQLSLLYVA